MVAVTARALGVATHADFRDYHRLDWFGLKHGTPASIDKAAEEAGLTPVTISSGPVGGPGRPSPGEGAARAGPIPGPGLAGRRRPGNASHHLAVPV